jgi:hypothetical protein
LLAAVEERIRRVAPAWTVRGIDVDHVGTLLRQHQRGKWTGNVLPKIDDPNTAQRACHASPRHDVVSRSLGSACRD